MGSYRSVLQMRGLFRAPSEVFRLLTSSVLFPSVAHCWCRGSPAREGRAGPRLWEVARRWVCVLLGRARSAFPTGGGPSHPRDPTFGSDDGCAGEGVDFFQVVQFCKLGAGWMQMML